MDLKEDQPTGEIKIKKTKIKRQDYRMIRNVRYKGVDYKIGDPLKITGKILAHFLRQGYCK